MMRFSAVFPGTLPPGASYAATSEKTAGAVTAPKPNAMRRPAGNGTLVPTGSTGAPAAVATDRRPAAAGRMLGTAVDGVGGGSVVGGSVVGGSVVGGSVVGGSVVGGSVVGGSVVGGSVVGGSVVGGDITPQPLHGSALAQLISRHNIPGSPVSQPHASDCGLSGSYGRPFKQSMKPGERGSQISSIA